MDEAKINMEVGKVSHLLLLPPPTPLTF